jgi:hypothetical protein
MDDRSEGTKYFNTRNAELLRVAMYKLESLDNMPITEESPKEYWHVMAYEWHAIHRTPASIAYFESKEMAEDMAADIVDAVARGVPIFYATIEDGKYVRGESGPTSRWMVIEDDLCAAPIILDAGAIEAVFPVRKGNSYQVRIVTKGGNEFWTGKFLRLQDALDAASMIASQAQSGQDGDVVEINGDRETSVLFSSK